MPNFRNQLIKNGRSRAMAKKIVISLGAILADAMTNGKVARNVVREQARQHRQRQRRLEKRHEKELEEGVDFPIKDEIRALLAHAHGRWRPLVITAIFTGLRASELRGLTWGDVDLDRKIITVRQRADRWNTIGSPKSDSGKRKVPLAPMVINTLKEWRLACAKGPFGLVFPNGDGHVEYLPNIHKRGLGPLEFAAGITTVEAIRTQQPELTDRQAVAKAKAHPKYGLHALRHARRACSSNKDGHRRRFKPWWATRPFRSRMTSTGTSSNQPTTTKRLWSNCRLDSSAEALCDINWPFLQHDAL